MFEVIRYEDHVHGLRVIIRVGAHEVSVWEDGSWELAEYVREEGQEFDDRRILDCSAAE